MNGLLRLIWTYLYRCQESVPATSTKLDNLLKHFFPSNRLTIFPPDDLEPFIYIVHFVLSRHFDYGRDLCLDLMQESSISPLQQSGNIGSVLSPERTSIAVQAVFLSLHAMEKESTTPSWPSSTDFSVVPTSNDYPSSSEFAPASVSSKAGMKDFLDRFGSTLAAIAVFCSNAVGHMSVFDEQWSYARLIPGYEEAHNFTIRRHQDSTIVAYPNHFVPQVVMLQTCFQSWPRCLHPSLILGDALDMLLRGVVHVDPALGETSCNALKRFMADSTQALTVLARFNAFLFSPSRIAHEGSGVRLLVESPHILDLWFGIVDGWIRGYLRQSKESVAEQEQLILPRCIEIEAAGLFLLTHEKALVYEVGVKIMRLLGLIVEHMPPSDGSRTLHFVEHFRDDGLTKSYLYGYDELLESQELQRLEQWRQSKRTDVALRIADSSNEKDRKLWRYVFPAFLQASIDNAGPALTAFRESAIATATRYHPTMAQLAGLSTRIPPGNRALLIERDGPKLLKENASFVEQWRIWVKVLCATATLPESTRPVLTQLGGGHTRAPSDASFERERLSTTRGLFRYLTPFLDSEYTLFRDAAVLCISSFPSNAYPQLLEDLSLLAGRQFYDDPRAKSGPLSAVEQNFGILGNRQFVDDGRSKPGTPMLVDRTRRHERLHSAVARIYYLTAPLLQHQRSAGRQAALANVLKFVRNTQTFLTTPEMRDDYTLQRLRRYFCGIVERLFDGLATLKDSDRFIPSNMHLTLYRLCEEWCQYGPQSEVVKQRFNLMQRAAASSVPRSESPEAVERFRVETQRLSQASVGALAALCVRISLVAGSVTLITYFPAKSLFPA
jgi:Cell morphogenesis N-terminal